MSTGWNGMLDVPTSMDPDDAIATMEAVYERVGWRHGEELGPFHHVSVADGIDVALPSEDVDAGEGLLVVAGRLVATLSFDNLEREVGPVFDETTGRYEPTGIHDGRRRIEVLFEALSRVCDAPVGTFVGSIQCETDRGDACPLIVTPEGVRMLATSGSLHEAYSYGCDPEEFPDQSSVPSDLIAKQDGWHWTVDLDALRTRLRGVVVDGQPKSVLTRRS